MNIPISPSFPLVALRFLSDGKSIFFLFLSGGAVYDNRRPDQLGRATNAVHVFDPRMRIWMQAPPMMERRAYHGLAAWRDRIYVIGGEDELKRLDSPLY